MDKRLNKLEIKLPNGWGDVSESNPNGPPTFINDSIGDSSVLQISTAEFLSGKLPNPSISDLVDLSRNIGLKNGFGDVQTEMSGNCDYGTFGCVQFSNSRFPFSSIWHLSDGRDFIFATFLCSIVPKQQVIDDVNTTLTSIKKKLWLGSLFG